MSGRSTTIRFKVTQLEEVRDVLKRAQVATQRLQIELKEAREEAAYWEQQYNDLLARTGGTA